MVVSKCVQMPTNRRLQRLLNCLYGHLIATSQKATF